MVSLTQAAGPGSLLSLLTTGVFLVGVGTTGVPSNAIGIPTDEASRGYYAFEKAVRPHQDRPPRVRKPPYHRANVHCPERAVYGRFSPRDTLCGDLNKGFIPRNPMGQRPVGDPYPL